MKWLVGSKEGKSIYSVEYENLEIPEDLSVELEYVPRRNES